MLELSNGTFESFVHFVIFASFSMLLGVIVVVRHAAARHCPPGLLVEC